MGGEGVLDTDDAWGIEGKAFARSSSDCTASHQSSAGSFWDECIVRGRFRGRS